ncbi:sulfatase [Aestuariivivens sp. NBU2969]|uniref:sulfatase n=1 Tax=Aestuariivivens sp. NBU2969 TaxID=2873267 RepID=UPI001CC0022F|nr:sulfatase [Aestuariivivens sp. NBU2969]
MNSKLFFSIGVLIFSLNSCHNAPNNIKPNILLICVDDLRPELNSFAANHIISPNIDELAQKGISFQKHYVNAPSCGPSRYTLLTGQYGPATNDALFQRAQWLQDSTVKTYPSMPEWFKKHGYTTVSIGKVSHHPGGRGGRDWNDSTIIEMPNAWDRHLMPVGNWLHPRGAMHGLANGEIRNKAEQMAIFQSAEGNDVKYPDDLTVNETLNQLKELTNYNDNPFFLAVGIIKPHLPFGAPKSYYDLYKDVTLPPIPHPEKPERQTTWHQSGEFMKYDRWGKDPNTDPIFAEEVRRHYAACVSYADDQVGKILKALKQSGAHKNTIVVLWGDHGWHLGEHAIWGKHSLFEESLHSPLIIYDPTNEKKNQNISSIVETLDIFPTLCDLTGIEIPEFVEGTSLKRIIHGPEQVDKTAVSYTPNAQTIRTNTHRLIVHNDGYVELYNHSKPEQETKNIADQHPELVKELTDLIQNKLH